MLKHKNALLQQLADGCKAVNQKYGLGDIRVTVRVRDSDVGFEFGLPEFLDVLANDLHWDERGDWSDATLLTVDTF